MGGIDRVLVFGGREFKDFAFVCRKLTELHTRLGPWKVIIHGAARGIDTMAGLWAVANGLLVDAYPVSGREWQQLGKRAGVLRNQRMLDRGHPQLAVKFPGGNGTEDMLARCKAQGLNVVEVI